MIGDPRFSWYRWLIRLGFHLLYNQFAWSYDLVAWVVSLGAWQSWGKASIPFLQGPRVLDLGHGPGHLLQTLETENFTAVGYDLSPAMGRIAKRRLGRQGLAPRLARGRAQALPFADNAFNSIVSTFPAEFIIQPETLTEIKRVLAPEGVFVLVPAAILTGRGPITRLIEGLYRLTGQRASEQQALPPPLAQANFQGETHWISLPGSQVLVIVNSISNTD